MSEVSPQLKEDIAFIRKQCAILTGDEKLHPSKASWMIRSHAKEVEHTVKILDEGMSKKETWGNTLLRFWVYSLYHHDRIESTLQFASQAYHSWATGESHLKPYADLLSDSEFAKKTEELPVEEQAKTAVELKLIEGILNGYIDYPSDLKKNHPAVAQFLLKKFNIAPPSVNKLESERGISEKIMANGGPDRRQLSEDDFNKMTIQYIGSKVRGYYKKTHRQLESSQTLAAEVDWTMNSYHTSDTSQIGFKEKKPPSPLEHFGQQLVAAIEENQRGIFIENNSHLRELQKGVEDVFGTPLPNAWIENRLFKQEWTEERLAHFSDWVSESMKAQAAYFIAQQGSSIQSEGKLITTPPLLTACVGQEEVGSAIHTIETLQTSSASRLSNPLSAIFETIRTIRSSLINALWETDRIGLEKMKTSLDPIHKEVLSQLETNRSLLQLQTLINSPAQLIDDKLFQHILGAYFGKKTGLEGHDPVAILNYLLEVANSKVKALKENPLCREKNQLAFCQTLSERNEEELSLQLFSAMAVQMKQAQELNAAFRGTLEEFIKEFKNKVDQLKNEESFFFSGGWKTPGGGHHVVYEVVKQSNQLFTLRLYNRGDGNEFHENALVQEKYVLLPFTEIVDIRSDRMTSIPFLKGLKDLQIPKDWKAKHLYEGILPILGGKNSYRVYSSDYLMEGQLVGHCGYMSFTPWMSQQLRDQSTYSRWQFEIELKTLVDYFKQQQHLLPFREEARHLLREGLSQFGRNTDAAYRDGLITDEEIVWIHELIHGISQAALQAEKIYKDIVVANATRVAIEPITRQFSAKIDTKLIENIESASAMPPRYVSVDPQAWKYVPQYFNKNLSVFLNEIRDARKVGQHINIKEGIQTFIEKVPLFGNVFWEGMTPDQGKEALKLLAALSRHYLFSIIMIRDQDKLRLTLDLEQYLIVAKMLTLADATLRHFKEDFGFEIPFLAQQEMLDVLNGQLPAINTLHVKWADELCHMRQYWNQILAIEPRDPNQLSFFGFEEPQMTRYPMLNIWENSKDSYLKTDVNVWGANFDWPHIEFAKKWMEKPEVAKQFAEDFPEHKNMPADFKAFIALGNRGLVNKNDGNSFSFNFLRRSNLLPEQFYDLRDIAYTASFLLKGPDILKGYALDSNIEPRIFLEVKRHVKNLDSQDRPYWVFTYRPFDLPSNQFVQKGYDLPRKFPLPPYIDPSMKLMHRGILEEKFVPFVGGTKPVPLAKDGSSNSNLLMRRRLSPHLRQIIEEIDEKEYFKQSIDNDSRFIHSFLGLEDTKQRLRLSSKDELQVLETLAFYFKEPHLLTQTDEQKFFQYLINEKGLFIEELLRSTKHAALRTQQIAKFIQSQFDTYEKLGNMSMKLFFLELNLQFKLLVLYTLKYYPKSFPQNFEIPFLDDKKELKSILENETNQDDDRSIAAYLFLKTFDVETELTAKEASELLYAGIQLHQYPPKGHPRWDTAKQMESLDLLRKLRGPLERALQGEGRNRILNLLLKKYHPNSSDLKWKVDGHFPRFIASDGFTKIDVLKGNFLHKKSIKKSP